MFVKLQSFLLKLKKINLGQKMPYLGIFGLGFEKNYVIFETSTYEFAKMKSFMLKEKRKKNRGLTVSYLGIFLTGISRNYCHI